MKLFLLFLISFNLFAFDNEQADLKCGLYNITSKLECTNLTDCYLVLGEAKLSRFDINLKKSKYSLSFFSGKYVSMDIAITDINKKYIAEVLSPPIQDIRAIKKIQINYKGPQECK